MEIEDFFATTPVLKEEVQEPAWCGSAQSFRHPGVWTGRQSREKATTLMALLQLQHIVAPNEVAKRHGMAQLFKPGTALLHVLEGGPVVLRLQVRLPLILRLCVSAH